MSRHRNLYKKEVPPPPPAVVYVEERPKKKGEPETSFSGALVKARSTGKAYRRLTGLGLTEERVYSQQIELKRTIPWRLIT